MPNNLEVDYLVQFIHTSQMFYTLSVRWEAPDNSDRFDLEHFRVQAFTSESAEIVYLLNGTTTELEYYFDFKTLPLKSNISIMVAAVSRCGQEGPTSSTVVVPENGDMHESRSQTDQASISKGNNINFCH